jgi:ABC-type phosphate transport system substrate-binding protein
LKTQNISRNCWARLLFLAVAMVAASAYADVVVIVSAKSPITSLTAEQTAKIFLGKTDTFPHDGNALPIDQAEGSIIRDEFYSKVTNKNSAQIKAYWSKIIFTGDGQPPKLVEGDVAVRKAVANNPNSIGYIDKNNVNNSVRVILEP